MQIAILGPLEVCNDAGDIVEVSGARVRTLLAVLALDVGKVVGVGALVDAVWGNDPPAEPNNALQTLVSRLRRMLGSSSAIVASQAGYRLAVEPDDVDVTRFAKAAADAAEQVRVGDWPGVERRVDDAVVLWRGPALAGLVDHSPTLAAQATRLEDTLYAALADRAEVWLRAGEPERAVSELEDRAWQRPLDERVAGQLMRALAGVGRQADALQTYERVRGRLADELGVDPSAALQDVQLATLRGEYGAAASASAHPAGAAAGSQPRRSNLRAQLTSFVGREDEVVRIGKSLEENRLVTLVGPGGAGKTRLSGESAAKIAESVPDGVWMVELAPISSAADVTSAVLNSVGLREMRDLSLRDHRTTLSTRDARDVLFDGLADKRLLLIFDNCEHLIEPTATLVDELLGECPGVRVLATSREPLGIVGETLLAVPPLGQPAPTASAAEAMEYPAVRLFADRAAAVAPDFVVDDGNVATVIEIVRRLDGLPLAIELAAARIRTTPLSDIAARLSDRFRLLTGGSRTALPRHRTLRAVVEWSWDLLPDPERTLVEQLSVFSGGITPSSAASVTDLDESTVADLLASLADKSLLQPVDGGRRMRMLETIREYGTERLDEQDRLAGARERHAGHFAQVIRDAEAPLLTRDQLPWFRLLAAERENILVAMRYFGGVGDADAALHIAITLGGQAMMIGAYTEISGWITEALEVPGGEDTNLRLIAEALHTLNVAANGGPADDPAAPDAGPSALADLARRLDDVPLGYSPMVPMLRGIVLFFAGEYEYARQYTERDVKEMSDWTRATMLMLRASLAENNGDLATLRVDAQACYDAFAAIGERWGMASALRMLGQIRTVDGDLDGAEEALRDAMRMSHELGSHDDLTFVYGRLADIAVRRDDFATARMYIERARSSADEHGDQMEAVFTSVMLGAVEFATGNIDAARELQEAALARVDELPHGHPVTGHFRALVLAISARIQAEDGKVDQAWASAREAYVAALETRDTPIIASVGVTTAYLASFTGDDVRAAVTLGAAAQLRGADDATSWEIVRLRRTLCAALGDDVFVEHYEQGKALDRNAATERLAPE